MLPPNTRPRRARPSTANSVLTARPSTAHSSLTPRPTSPISGPGLGRNTAARWSTLFLPSASVRSKGAGTGTATPPIAPIARYEGTALVSLFPGLTDLGLDVGLVRPGLGTEGNGAGAAAAFRGFPIRGRPLYLSDPAVTGTDPPTLPPLSPLTHLSPGFGHTDPTVIGTPRVPPSCNAPMPTPSAQTRAQVPHPFATPYGGFSTANASTNTPTPPISSGQSKGYPSSSALGSAPASASASTPNLELGGLAPRSAVRTGSGTTTPHTFARKPRTPEPKTARTSDSGRTELPPAMADTSPTIPLSPAPSPLRWRGQNVHPESPFYGKIQAQHEQQLREDAARDAARDARTPSRGRTGYTRPGAGQGGQLPALTPAMAVREQYLASTSTSTSAHQAVPTDAFHGIAMYHQKRAMLARQLAPDGADKVGEWLASRNSQPGAEVCETTKLVAMLEEENRAHDRQRKEVMDRRIEEMLDRQRTPQVWESVSAIALVQSRSRGLRGNGSTLTVNATPTGEEAPLQRHPSVRTGHSHPQTQTAETAQQIVEARVLPLSTPQPHVQPISLAPLFRTTPLAAPSKPFIRGRKALPALPTPPTASIEDQRRRLHDFQSNSTRHFIGVRAKLVHLAFTLDLLRSAAELLYAQNARALHLLAALKAASKVEGAPESRAILDHGIPLSDALEIESKLDAWWVSERDKLNSMWDGAVSKAKKWVADHQYLDKLVHRGVLRQVVAYEKGWVEEVKQLGMEKKGKKWARAAVVDCPVDGQYILRLAAGLETNGRIPEGTVRRFNSLTHGTKPEKPLPIDPVEAAVLGLGLSMAGSKKSGMKIGNMMVDSWVGLKAKATGSGKGKEEKKGGGEVFGLTGDGSSGQAGTGASPLHVADADPIDARPIRKGTAKLSDESPYSSASSREVIFTPSGPISPPKGPTHGALSTDGSAPVPPQKDDSPPSTYSSSHGHRKKAQLPPFPGKGPIPDHLKDHYEPLATPPADLSSYPYASSSSTSLASRIRGNTLRAKKAAVALATATATPAPSANVPRVEQWDLCADVSRGVGDQRCASQIGFGAPEMADEIRNAQYAREAKEALRVQAAMAAAEEQKGEGSGQGMKKVFGLFRRSSFERVDCCEYQYRP
ncbi:uncharacterized protein MKK02DRAFT_43152 [Dioszegia hungarica]|uniref:Uncharacterized protein n=1 Tax=Dioszegia hungarica TaxID=4972 RepID=A0AA38HA02_9TREE|nr:uncharacterized protein MKK02DRAFT_43152 [Dioszegia hungarica]KAI9637232.1 hypothetical protein MKK02DRAFT_43152 [Dioszegia hungarica]